MKINEIINENISRRGFLKGAGAAATGAALSGCATKPAPAPEEDIRKRFGLDKGIFQFKDPRTKSDPSTEIKQLDSDVFYKLRSKYQFTHPVPEPTGAFGHHWHQVKDGRFIRLIEYRDYESKDRTTSYYVEIASEKLIRNQAAAEAKRWKDREDAITNRAKATGLYEEPIDEDATPASIKKVNSLFSR
jgi:hypothetical protein